jgi:hypothetical protein
MNRPEKIPPSFAIGGVKKMLFTQKAQLPPHAHGGSPGSGRESR